MKTLFNTLKRYGRILRGFIPRPLPVGVTQFNAWVDRFLDTYPMPTTSRRDVTYVLASMIIHGDKVMAYRSDFRFFLAIWSAAAKQVAGAVFQNIQYELKAEHTAQQAAQLEASKKQPEVTATPAASDGPKV